MGSSGAKPALADLDIYICGIGHKSTHYRLLKRLFAIENSNLNGNIKLSKTNENYYINNVYEYEYRYYEKTIKNINEKEITIKYNSYIFSDISINNSFSKVLSFYFYEYDVHNIRKNVLVSFAEENRIKNSISELYKKSNESLPIIIFITNNKNYNEQLDYVNYIPSVTKIREDLFNGNNNSDHNIDIHELSEKLFVKYLKSKLFRIYAYYNELGYNLNFIKQLSAINYEIQTRLTIALLGESGCGKSTLLNLIFNELVARMNASSKDVTTKCSEYYLPIKLNNGKKYIRFLDFPGLKEEKNYEIVKNNINYYRQKSNHIYIALFYISNGNNRLNSNSIKLIKLLHKNNIKIIFIINGITRKDDLIKKKQALKNEIGNDEILNDNFDNFVNCDYKLEYDLKRKDAISTIFSKINDIHKINIMCDF